MEPTATLFDIQRFCLHDGPGIRTTVFFKGCPLRCLWCHNPESLSVKPQLVYRAHKCSGCGACAYVCETGAHRFQNGSHLLCHTECSACGACAGVCCYDAVELLGKRYSLAEIVASVMTDAPYFKTGGGVTLSGGEPLVQPEFASALAAELRLRDVHVALETCGYAKQETFLSVVEHIDLVLFDYKATGEEEHKKLTGITSKLILENLAALDDINKRTILRCPLIPGLNDHDGHLAAIAGLCEQHACITDVELLPYHRMGETKRGQLGLEPSLPELAPPDKHIQGRWLAVLQELGCEAKIV